MEKITIFDIEAGKFIDKLAEELKKIPEFEAPEWAKFVKTGPAKARTPFESDWWFKRAASVLRQIYLKKVMGVSRLRTRYGSKKNRGMRPERFMRGSGKIIRVILQKSEKAGFAEKAAGKKVGRKLTKKGKDFLDSVAASIK